MSTMKPSRTLSDSDKNKIKLTVNNNPTTLPRIVFRNFLPGKCRFGHTDVVVIQGVLDL